MSEYHKIETLFERDMATFVVDPMKLKSPVLGTINLWDVTEKIDGTNVRVMLSEDGIVTFGGRTDNAQMDTGLLKVLQSTFTPEKMQAAFWLDGTPVAAVLYGEGYGAGIQKGGTYRPDKDFILFDVRVGKWWLDREAVHDVSGKLQIDEVPYLGQWTLSEIWKHVKDPFPSRIGTGMAEGIVARPIEPLFDRKGSRVIIKLKTRDFQTGKR